MSESVGSLHYDLNIDDKNLKPQLDAADKSVSNFGDKLKSGLTKAAVVFGAVGVGLSAIAKNATDFTVDLVKDAKALGREIGVTTTEASRLTAAFRRMGIDADKARTSFGIFSKQIVASTESSTANKLAVEKLQLQIDKTRKSIADTTAEIKKHGDKSGELNGQLKMLNNTLASQENALKQNADAFAKLGINTKDSNGKQKDFNTLLFEVADKFKAMPDGIDKTATALQLFGRQGKDMIKVLNLGSDGIKELEKQADKLGLTLTPGTVDKINALVKSQKDLKEKTDAVKIAIGLATAPALTKFNNKLAELITKLEKTDGPLKSITNNFLAFGGPVASGVAAIAAFGASLAQIASVLGAGVLGAIAGIGSLIVAAVGIWIFNIVKFVQNFAAIKDGFIAGLHIIGDNIVAIVVMIGNWFRNLVIGVGDTIVSVWQWFASLPGRILSAVGSLGGLLFNAGRDVIIGLANGITGNANMVWNGIKSAADKIGQFFAGAGAWLFNVGKAIVQGLIDGIKSMVSSVSNAAGNIGDTVKNKVKSLLGIRSPSKVFEGFGRNVVQGFVKGIDKSSHLADMAINGLNNNIIPPSVNITSMNGASAPNTSGGDTYVNIGTVNDKSDAEYILRRINTNQQLESMGLSSVGG